MIPYGKQYIDNNDINAVIEVLKSNYLTTGPKVEEFEENICTYTGAKYALSCGNGTQALHLAYLALDLQKGDEVITTANSFVATSNMVITTGATPVFCDIKLSDYNIDEDKIESLITKNTKAISVVHFAGRPCNITKIWEIAEKYNIKVIEDGAHALGASFNGEKIGNTQSDLTTFSFHPVKPITMGEGGVVTTNNKEYYQKMLQYRSHGIQRDENGCNNMVSFGYNYRITDIQCALGISQLTKLDNFIKKRKNIAQLYKKYLNKDKIILPQDDDNIYNSGWHLYVVRFENKNMRDNIMNILKESGYGVTLHYAPIYSHSYYQNNGYKNVKCENAEKYYETCLSLPIFPQLEEKEIENISYLINNNL